MNATRNDLQALWDLLNETNHTDYKVSFKDITRGHAHLDTKKTSIPLWVLNRGETYAFYYVIHEYTHQLTNSAHDQTFKDTERNLLAQFNINIEYRRAYPSRLSMSGETKYHNPRKTRSAKPHTHVYSTILYIDGITWAKCHFCKAKHILRESK